MPEADPEKVRAAIAERRAEADLNAAIADAFHDAAGRYEHEELRIRCQIAEIRDLLPPEEAPDA